MLQWIYNMLRIEVPEINEVDKVYRKTRMFCRNTKRVCKYWNPLYDNERIRIREETKQWKTKTNKMIICFIFLWVVIIAVTIWVCIK